ncbi:MAG: hypothetical protein ABSF95_20445 [Verrucomicrobiota bacterium]
MVRVCAAGLVAGSTAPAQEIGNGLVTVRAVRQEKDYAGFDLLTNGNPAAVVRLSSARVQLVARKCEVRAAERALVFSGLQAARDSGLALGARDALRVALKPGEPYPVVWFDLTVAGFDPAQWTVRVGREPFHFLALYLPEAEAWHQGGWLNATPLADPFPLLLDRHAGTPEISAYPYNRNWSYTPPLGAQPLPVIGLWAPSSGRYVGLEFQTTRLEDNSEKDLATGYRWQPGPGDQRAEGGQFVALVYPFGGQGYQQLLFPSPGARLKSHGTLLWSRDLPARDDPNRLLWSFLWERIRDRLPRPPEAPDVGWIPGGLRRGDFEGPAAGGLIGGVEEPFQVAGSKVLAGWGWHNESPTAAPARRGDTNRLQALEREAEELLRLARHFQAGGQECVFWEKPLAGQWTEEWGGKAVTTLHNANGFAAGRLFLGLYRDLGRTQYLPVIDGVFNWARHIAWTRNEFADVPSSPFAIGGTLSASFCLDYYMTFQESPDARRRQRARSALELARALTYRYLVMWPSDNNRQDNLDSAFLWEPNSGRDWTGAACANEVFWNLDTLAQTAVHTGDPVLAWALQGSLSRWHLLYQDVLRNKLADYQPGDMTEGYGLYAGNIYGLGRRASYGFAGALVMTEPVGRSAVRLLAGERAALAFRKGPAPIRIVDYRYTPPGNLAFTVRADQPPFDLSLTVPYVDLSSKRAALVRHGNRRDLKPGEDFTRPPQALWSLYLKNVEPNDRVIIGEPDETAPRLPTSPPLAQDEFSREPAPLPPAPAQVDDWEIVRLRCDRAPDLSWENPAGWAGLPRGRRWIFGIPFELETLGNPCAVTRPIRLAQPIRAVDCLYLLYESGPGPAPSLLYADGHQEPEAARTEALAWRAWPPLFTAKLLLARLPVPPDGQVVGLQPAGRAVWALTVPKVKRADAQVGAALAQGAAEWKRLCREEAALAALRQAVAAIPQGAVAILPPSPGGDIWTLAQRAGLDQRATLLNAAQLVERARFNARRSPAALYADGEDYVHTVRDAGDGAAALERYVREGGALVIVPSQPWPFYYATGPNLRRPEALTDKLGLPLANAIETPPPEKLTVRVAPGQSLVKPERREFPFPPGDPRLRSIERSRLPSGAKYTPLATVVGESGKSYGDAAGLIELPNGGRIFYLSCNLSRDPEHGLTFNEAALRFLLRAAQPPAPPGLTLGREGQWLVVRGGQLPGQDLRINYLEAYCRADSTDADWAKHTVIPHTNELLSLSPDRKVLRLRDTLADGLVVEHTITAGQDEVDFRLVARNPTGHRSEAHWAQPCVRLGAFTGFSPDLSQGDVNDYLPKCFIFLAGRLTRLPTRDWATRARYTPGQVWCPPHVPRTDLNPRPLSQLLPSNGLIGCFSGDEKLLLATAWEPYQELFQGVARCLHSDFRLGGLRAGETLHIRGKIYLLTNNLPALLQRYARDFPEQAGAGGR